MSDLSFSYQPLKVPKLWYVLPGGPAGGDGSAEKPFDSFASLFAGGVYGALGNTGETVIVLGATSEPVIWTKLNVDLLGFGEGTLLMAGAWDFAHAASSVRVRGLAFKTLTWSGAGGGLYLRNCRTQTLVKSGSGHFESDAGDHQYVVDAIPSISITGANMALFGFGSKIAPTVINNPAAFVSHKDGSNAGNVRAMSGTFQTTNTPTITPTAATPAIIGDPGSTVILGSDCLVYGTGALAKIELRGSYSLAKMAYYDSPNSVLSGTNMPSASILDAVQFINLPTAGANDSVRAIAMRSDGKLVYQLVLKQLGNTIDNTLATPPVSPTAGDTYIVPSGATGAWAGQATKLATWDGTSWTFTAPATNDATTILSGTNAGLAFYFTGTAWAQKNVASSSVVASSWTATTRPTTANAIGLNSTSGVLEMIKSATAVLPLSVVIATSLQTAAPTNALAAGVYVHDSVTTFNDSNARAVSQGDVYYWSGTAATRLYLFADMPTSLIVGTDDYVKNKVSGALRWVALSSIASQTVVSPTVAKSWVVDNSTSAGGAVSIYSTDETDTINRTIDTGKTATVTTVPGYTITSSGVFSSAGTLSAVGGGNYTLSGANTVANVSVSSNTTVNVTGSIAPTGTVTVELNSQLNRSTTAAQTWTNAWSGYGGVALVAGAGKLTLAQSSASDTWCYNSFTVPAGTTLGIALTGGGGYANWLGTFSIDGTVELSLVDIRRHFFDCAVKGSGTIRVTSPTAVGANIYDKRATFRARANNLFTGVLELSTNAIWFFQTYSMSGRVSMTDATAVLALFGSDVITVGGWSGTGIFKGESGPNYFVFGGNNLDSVWVGTANGPINLTKQGTGRHVINGQNFHNGTTTISAGKLGGFGLARASPHVVSAGAAIFGAAPGASGTYSCGKLNFSAATSALDVHSDGAAVSQVNLNGTNADTMVAASGFKVNLIDAMPAGQFTIISAVNAPSLPATLPTIGTNASGRTATLAWVAGIGLRLTLV